jgi:hypothetical protein
MVEVVVLRQGKKANLTRVFLASHRPQSPDYLTLNVGEALYVISFSFNATGSYLHTDIGTIVLDAPLALSIVPTIAPHELRRQGYGISFDGKWITKRSENMLWLPVGIGHQAQPWRWHREQSPLACCLDNDIINA